MQLLLQNTPLISAFKIPKSSPYKKSKGVTNVQQAMSPIYNVPYIQRASSESTIQQLYVSYNLIHKDLIYTVQQSHGVGQDMHDSYTTCFTIPESVALQLY